MADSGRVQAEGRRRSEKIEDLVGAFGWARKWPELLVWVGLALVAGLFYVAVSAWGFGYSGFPLDDAWIHQTYARNLARSGQLAFTPGAPSAGSTSPLWTLLLALAYLMAVPFQVWTYGLGMLFLGLTGWTAQRLGERLFPESRRVGLWAGLFCVLEWHLIWAAVSGMETILFVWLSLFLFERYLKLATAQPRPGVKAELVQKKPGFCAITSIAPTGKKPGFLRKNSIKYALGLGILAGLLILTRPEGLGLAGLIGLDMAGRRLGGQSRDQVRQLAGQWLGLAAGAGLIVLPYILFHLQLTGLPFPNTLYAKQAEYGEILNSFPLWQRLFGSFERPVETVQGVFQVIFIGPQFLLLPGLLAAAWLTVKERRWRLLPLWGWWISYLLLYGLRLPVTYQHGRYQIPAIAWVVLLGIWGLSRLTGSPPGRRAGSSTIVRRVGGRALALSLALLLAAFVIIGAQAYGRDVRFISSEMVAAATWLNAHAAPDALIAAHDIGAIGYFTQRRLIDLAGLVTPEVIPFIRDEAALFEFMIANEADYLVTFPSWYPQMVREDRLELIYSTQAPWGPQAGGDNMAVYRIAE